MSPTNASGRLVAAAILLTLAGAPPVLAGDSRWHVEGRLGRSALDTRLGQRWPKTFDAEDTSASIELGYSLHRLLGLQAGYHDLGSFTGIGSPCPEDAEDCVELLAQRIQLCIPDVPCPQAVVPVTADVDGFSLSLMPRWPVNDRLAVFGRVGVLDWEARVSAVQPFWNGARIDRFSGQHLLAGLGARYDFRGGLLLLIEARRLDRGADTLDLGVGWQF